ncbi:MAG: ATP-binding cassette domain-containing protein [Christensenellaceae bacterium]|jgi:energy-coupling factor transport system ATP-binding protein|nr:ATP-binding cassette domain-containing protein [Christensenellaceae bacterium]
MIELKNLGFRYSGAERHALDGISLTIEDGAFLGLIGSSGAGKSTLCYALSGIVPHHYRGDFYGELLVEGMDSAEHRPEEIARVLGCVFQDIDGQMVASVVEDEILFGLENFGVPREEIEGRVAEALAAAGISELRCRAISDLSGGQKQKVAIAAITALRPKIIVLDEPTGELDPRSSRRVFETLKELNEQYGVTIVVVEQKIMLLCEFAKRLAVMEEGKLILEGEVREVLQSAGRMEAAGVNIPRVTTLARALREEGLYGGRLPLNLEEGEKMMREVGLSC